MKKLLTSLLVLSAAVSGLCGQNIKKAYTTHTQANGTLYFIVPQEVFSGKGAGGLTLDMAKVSSSDTVRMNFTVGSSDIIPFDEVLFVTGDQTRTYSTEKIYIRPAKKKAWEHRYNIVLPFSNMEAIFTAPQPPTVILRNGQGAAEYGSKEKKWKDYSGNIRTIISIMSIND